MTYMYEEPGDYTVVLTVTNDKGATGTAQQVLSIAHPEPNHDPIFDSFGDLRKTDFGIADKFYQNQDRNFC